MFWLERRRIGEFASEIGLPAKVFRVQVQTVEVSSVQDFEGAFAAAARNGAQAVVLLSSPLVSRHGREIAYRGGFPRCPCSRRTRPRAV